MIVPTSCKKRGRENYAELVLRPVAFSLPFGDFLHTLKGKFHEPSKDADKKIKMANKQD